MVVISTQRRLISLSFLTQAKSAPDFFYVQDFKSKFIRSLVRGFSDTEPMSRAVNKHLAFRDPGCHLVVFCVYLEQGVHAIFM